MLKTRKVVIVGAGHVGSHVALALIQSGEADDIVLIDILKEKAAAQALDLDDGVSGALCGHDAKIRAGEYSELNDADILVMAFGRSRRPGETRLDMFDDSIKMANEVISHLKQVDFKAPQQATAANPFKPSAWANTVIPASLSGRPFASAARALPSCAPNVRSWLPSVWTICSCRLKEPAILRLTARAARNLVLPMLPAC